MIFLYYMCLFIVSYFIWAYIHEMSHIIAAKNTVGLEWYSLRIYPHYGYGRFNWASCLYMTKKDPTPKEQVIISLAPRVPGLLALVLFPISGLLIEYNITMVTVIPTIFTLSGVLDVATGSIGISKSSDLVTASDALKISPWKIRMIGAFTVCLSLVSFYFIAR